MIFRTIVFAALGIGLLTGSVYGIFQQLAVNPIIYAAETYEIGGDEKANNSAEKGSHSHHIEISHSGYRRILSTLFSNVLIAIGFSVILLSVMTLHNLKSTKPRVNWRSGILWGMAALVSFYLAPTLVGLGPELPGAIAPDLLHRQGWWIGSITATLAGIALLYYGSTLWKILGAGFIILPSWSYRSVVNRITTRITIRRRYRIK